MFYVTYRIGTESHDVYNYGPWQVLEIDHDEVWNFATAEHHANTHCLSLIDWDGVWQIREISREPSQIDDVRQSLDLLRKAEQQIDVLMAAMVTYTDRNIRQADTISDLRDQLQAETHNAFLDEHGQWCCSRHVESFI